MAVDVQTGPSLRPGRPNMLFEGKYLTAGFAAGYWFRVGRELREFSFQALAPPLFNTGDLSLWLCSRLRVTGSWHFYFTTGERCLAAVGREAFAWPFSSPRASSAPRPFASAPPD
jgi:hypothetical protein